MPFSIQKKQSGGLDLIVLRNDELGTTAEIIPASGALLHAFTVNTADGPLNIIDNYRNAAELGRELSMNYKSAKLSPFPCRIADARYEFNGRHYEFAKKFMDGSAIHGLLFNKPFIVAHEKAGSDEATVVLSYHYMKDDPGYPFTYVCEISYTLEKTCDLRISTTVTNYDAVQIPVADGWHPYFRLGGKVNDWQMQFSADRMLEFNEALIPTGRFIVDTYFKELRPIGERTLDNCFFLPSNSASPCCVLYQPQKKLRLEFYAGAGYPYLQVYTPDDRESIAIENLSAAPDAFNNHMGLTVLDTGESATFNLMYRVVVQ